VERGFDSVMFLAIFIIALLFFAFFFEKWIDKELIKRTKRLKRERYIKLLNKNQEELH